MRGPLVFVGAVIALAGCSINPQPSAGTGQGMMGGGSASHYSRLTCAAPTNLPGSKITVLLGDMGMTQMMDGTAPLGSRMMLRAVPWTQVRCYQYR